MDHKTQRFYEQGLALFANHKLKDGSRAGSKQISDFTKGFVDAVYAKLLVVEDKDADGKIVKRERRRSANAAMTACRRAWFVGQRAQETKVPGINPFSRMGLKIARPASQSAKPQRRLGTSSSHSEWPQRNSDTARSERRRCDLGVATAGRARVRRLRNLALSAKRAAE